MNDLSPQRPRRIAWQNVLTVVSAAILISAEVFGAAFAGSWAIANLFALRTRARRIVHAVRHRRDGAVRARSAPRRAVHGGLTSRSAGATRNQLWFLRFLKTKSVARAN